MDAGISAIIAASISTLAGGVIGFFSSFYTTKQLNETNKRQSTLPRQIDAAEFVGTILYKKLEGKSVNENEIDKYISSSYWLPKNLRAACLAAIANNFQLNNIKTAHSMLVEYFDNLTEEI